MASNRNQFSLQEELENAVTCPICTNHFDDPRVLPCSHTFCFKCIKKIPCLNGGRLRCPLCCATDISINEIGKIQKNLVVREIVESIKSHEVKCCNNEEHTATRWCRDCQNKGFCQECYEYLHKLPAFSNHRPSESEPIKTISCPQHPEKEAEFWCAEDKLPLCSKCLLSKQKQHKCELINDVFKLTSEEMIDKFTKHPLSTDPKSEMDKILQKYEKESNEKKSYFIEAFEKLRRNIDERQKDITEKFSDYDLSNRKKINEYHRELMVRHRQLYEKRLLFNRRVAIGDQITILRESESYTGILEQLKQQLADLKPPTLQEFEIEGLGEALARMSEALDEIKVVKREDYANADLDKLISQQKDNPILNLNNKELYDLDTIIIAKALRENKNISTLHMGNNSILDAGAKRIADALSYNKTLIVLNLWGNKIGNDGAKHLATALGINTTLLELNLSANEIDNAGAQSFANILIENKKLKVLSLADNKIDDEGAKCLANALKQNKTLEALHILQNERISASVRTELQNEKSRIF